MKLAKEIQTAVLAHDSKKLRDVLKSNNKEDIFKSLVEEDGFGSSAVSYILRTGDKEILNTFIENYLPSKSSKSHINGNVAELEIAVRMTEFDKYDITKCLETVYEDQDVTVLLGHVIEGI